MVELPACISDCSILTVITGFSHANQGANLTNQLSMGIKIHMDTFASIQLYGSHAKSRTGTKIRKKKKKSRKIFKTYITVTTHFLPCLFLTSLFLLEE